MDPTTLSNKIPQINFTIFYWKFVVSTIILNSLVQEVEAYDPTLPKRHWTGELWTQFLKIDLSLEKWKFKPYQFAPGPIFQPPPLSTQLHFLWLLINPLGFTRSLQPAGIDLIDSLTLLHMSVKILKSLISKPNQSCRTKGKSTKFPSNRKSAGCELDCATSSAFQLSWFLDCRRRCSILFRIFPHACLRIMPMICHLNGFVGLGTQNYFPGG